MKCPKCGGNAELSNWGSYVDPDYADFHVECEKCGYHSMGSTEPNKAKEMFEKGMGMYYTNEEWLKQCTTEQLAEWFGDWHSFSCVFCKHWQNGCIYNHNQVRCAIEEGKSNKELWVEWLKQPHKEN